MLRDLDENGIIRVGAEVNPGDYLVGKVTPKGETELTPERLPGDLRREGPVVRTSLKVPHGESGKVIDVRVAKRSEGYDLAPGVNETVRVYVAQQRRSPKATSWPAATATRASSPRSSPRRTCRSWRTARRSTSSFRRLASPRG